MQLSYWEQKNWFTNVDFTIVGSGIVGLHTALSLREKFPKSKILVLEKGILPQGASTKNAGFACFGSISEIIDDLKTHSEEEVIQLVQKRIKGLELLRNRLGDTTLDFKQYGGYELFLKEDEAFYSECFQKIPFVNDVLKPLFNDEVFVKKEQVFGFQNIFQDLIYNPFEGQIDTGNMMQALVKEAFANDILILNQQNVTSFEDLNDKVQVVTNETSFVTNKLFVCN